MVWFAQAPDNRCLAYGVSIGGSEESVLHVKEVATGRDLGESITRTNYGPPAWTEDGRLVYNRLQALAADAPAAAKYVDSRVFLHPLGTDPQRDLPLLGRGVTAGVELDPVAESHVMFAPGSAHAFGLV